MQLVHLLPVILSLQKQFPLESQVVEFIDPLTLQPHLKFIMGIDVEIIVVFLYISANIYIQRSTGIQILCYIYK